jgi:hypothetical protein
MEDQINTTEQPKKTFFGKVKDFFSHKPQKEEVTPKESPAQIPTTAQVLPANRKVRFEECFWCKEPVYEDEHYSKQMGHEFHRKCYKKFLQAGRRNKI